MSGLRRPLLAARASPGDGSGDGNDSPVPPPGRPTGGKAKRTLIESACSACRKRKSKCDGARPVCSRCQNLRTDCRYEAEEGESRWSALRRRNQILGAERDQMRELFALIQTRPEGEAMEIFHRLRAGTYDDAFSLLRQIKENSNRAMPPTTLGPIQAIIGGMAEQQQRLPPIHAIFDRNVAALNTTPSQHSLSLSSEESRGSSSNLDMPHQQPLLAMRSLPEPLEPSPMPPQLKRSAISMSSEGSTASMAHESDLQRSPS